MKQMFSEVDLLTGKEMRAEKNGFTDAQFMTAKEKEMVAKAFDRFLKSNFDNRNFTKRLYDHLHLHCGFIAHYDINGFYATYFEDHADTVSFLDRLFKDRYALNLREYEDLGKAMVESFKKHKESIKTYLHGKMLESADEVMRQAQKQYELRRALADKILDNLP